MMSRASRTRLALTRSITHSLSHKFMVAILLTTATALLVSAIAMVAYEVNTFRTSWVNDLNTQANILAQVTVPALEFNDVRAAHDDLRQLQARPDIYAAATYGSDGKLFASYANDKFALADLPLTPNVDGYQIEGSQITIFKTITRNREIIGSIYLVARYPLAERLQSYLMILLAVMVASLVVAALISTWLQAGVTKPILALTDAALQVIHKRDFSLRVKKSTSDEVGVLVDAFNSMLAEVGHRAEALEQSNLALQHEVNERLSAEEALRQLNNTLEERIQTRTFELERAHEQLRQSQKMEAIGQLTGGVAHDFNNVLQVINGNIQLLQMNFSEQPDAQRRLATAAFASDRGAKLAAQLLAFARRQPLQPVPTNLGRILRGMDDLLRRSIGEAIQIETIVASGLWNTFVDPNQLENVILNLCINARDAMQNGGRLILELSNAMLDDHYSTSSKEVPAGPYVMLGISDTGSGMTADVADRAFEPFFTTKREGQGTGLGLSMAYGFVKQSNGHIKIYSEVGYGTTIKIYLPRSVESEIELVNILAEPVVGGRETIFVVEDDAAVRATTMDILAGLGYRLLEAQDGDSALVVLQSGQAIDMLFTDVVMPGSLRSPELAVIAKQMYPDIAVLFTSGYTQDAIVHSGRLDPGLELMSKPYRREDLARKIRHMLNNRKMIINLAAAINSPADNTLAVVSAISEKNIRSLDTLGLINTVSDAEQSTSAVEESNMTTTAEASGLRILVVEDNLDGQLMVCELLTMMGHQPIGVVSAELALEKLATLAFDVLMTDVNLPGMSGVRLARQVVKDIPGLKIIFSSGYGAISEKELGFEARSLPKPYTFEDLQQMLEQLSLA